MKQLNLTLASGGEVRVAEGQKWVAKAAAENKGTVVSVEGTGDEDYKFVVNVVNPKSQKEIPLTYSAKKADGTPAFAGETVQGFANSWSLYEDAESGEDETSEPATDPRLAALGGDEETSGSEESFDFSGGETVEVETPVAEEVTLDLTEPPAQEIDFTPAPELEAAVAHEPVVETPEPVLSKDEAKAMAQAADEFAGKSSAQIRKEAEANTPPAPEAAKEPKAGKKDKAATKKAEPVAPVEASGTTETFSIPLLTKETIAGMSSDDLLEAFDKASEVLTAIEKRIEPLKTLIRAKIEEEEKLLLQRKRRLGLEQTTTEGAAPTGQFF